ncbi:MAG: VWA domain-containing protein [Candidatus Marinimicrobia bacterium]|nr:VWA domain-containing protein [Candidatus Neomarinimicrobiota bacterium]
MKSIIQKLNLLMVLSSALMANGVCIVDAEFGSYLRLMSSTVNVQVENQVAVITATQVFKNTLSIATEFKYAFPLAEAESAIALRWYMNQQWQEAAIGTSPQDTTIPGGGGEPNEYLETYLGETPLYFGLTELLEPDSVVIIELTYVNLLPYEFGNVSFHYPNDYSLIQNSYLDMQQIEFTINSERDITQLLLLSHLADVTTNNGNIAYVKWTGYELVANQDYSIQFALSPDDLGLFGLSTYLDTSQVPDEGGRGFFVFVAEPDAGNSTDVIRKVFTLIVDRSGSMSGNKIVQARNASSFIVNNLNQGDKFNIVDFSSDVSSFQPAHVDFNPANAAQAQVYISGIHAFGSTNISEAFSVAIPQFAAANDSTANIIVFFTDGEATSGITDTPGILNHVQDIVNASETEIMVFPFGIGTGANEQLLSQLANQNEGIAYFLGNDELEASITQFYLLIRNPVLLNTELSFSLTGVSQAYPSPLPNLYVGQQMIVAGRYNNPGTVNVNLNGEAFGQPVSYSYPLELAGDPISSYQFLPKIWAKKKIENLLIQYYILGPGSPAADEIRAEIVTISLNYGVITPFTSFTDPTVGIEEIFSDQVDLPVSFKVLDNFPNPFNAGTTIRFETSQILHRDVTIMIYNSLGQLVKILTRSVSGPGMYEVFWDGTLQNGELAPSGVYVYLIDFGSAILGGKMIMVK